MFTRNSFSQNNPPNDLPDAVTLLEQIGDCFLAVDDRWHITYINTQGAQVLGRTGPDLIGRHLWAEFPGFEEGPFGQAYHRARQTQQPVFFEAFCSHSQRWFTCRVYPSATGLSIFLRDRTEAREAWRQLEEDAAQRRHLLSEAREEADRDPLTGLWNHRVFQKRLADQSDPARREGRSLAVVMLDLDNFKFFNDAYGHVVGDDVLRRAAEHLRRACRSGDTLARFGGDEFALLLPSIDSEMEAGLIAARLAGELGGMSYKPPGHDVAIPISLSLGVALLPGDAPAPREVLQVADERLRQAKTGPAFSSEAQPLRLALRNRVQGFSMLEALVTAVDNKDRYTRRHSEDVMHYSLQIARVLSLEESMLHTVAVSALLHDVGKIGVPDAVLRKPGRLTEDEFEAIKQHPNIGMAIVAAVPGMEETLDAVHHHHERWDGEGYPFGLRGEETPLLARLMAVADAYSAMTTDRPYRKGMDPEKALRILEEGAGTQWDPSCVHALLQARQGM